jgi:hypothetical protein
LIYNDPSGENIFMAIWENIQGRYIDMTITNVSNEVNSYWYNAPIMFAIIHEEQMHQFPLFFEDEFWWNTIWLSQISIKASSKDKKYFWFQDNIKNDLLNNTKHLEIMNERIEVIKSKLIEEWIDATPWNIGKTWNWWSECVKSNWKCSEHAIEYWERIEQYYNEYKIYNNIINESKNEDNKIKYEEYKNYYSEDY